MVVYTVLAADQDHDVVSRTAGVVVVMVVAVGQTTVVCLRSMTDRYLCRTVADPPPNRLDPASASVEASALVQRRRVGVVFDLLEETRRRRRVAARRRTGRPRVLAPDRQRPLERHGRERRR